MPSKLKLWPSHLEAVDNSGSGKIGGVMYRHEANNGHY